MSRLWKVALAAAAVAAAVPMAIVVAGPPSDADGDDITRQTAAWTGKQEAGKNWKTVPGLELGQSNAIFTPGLLSATVSAEMRRGAVKLRLVPLGGGPAVPPGPVRFDSRAANSFSWAVRDTCGQGQFHEFQWKKVGKKDAVAAKIATHFVWNELCL